VKPLGTITICFPHVDEETRAVLQSVMEEAEHFGDFARRLSSRVCSESTTPLAEYLASSFVYMIAEYNILDALESAGKISEMSDPFLLQSKNRRGKMVTWDEMKQSIQKAIKAAPNDWIAGLLYLLWRTHVEDDFPECDTDVSPIETLIEGVREDKDLEYLKAYLLRIQLPKLRREGNDQVYIDTCNQALVLAKKYDDQILVADLLSLLAFRTKNTDMKRGTDILYSAKSLSEQLDYKEGLASVQHQLGGIMGVRGELDAAIEHNLQGRTVWESISYPTTGVNSVIAFYFNVIGNGEKALEFVETAIGTIDSRRRWVSYAHAQKAWALINLGRNEEAEAEISKARISAPLAGDTAMLVLLDLIEGILDKSEKRYDNAVQTFVRVLNTTVDPLRRSVCLLNLTEIEIEMLPKESLQANIDSSGPWMDKLNEHIGKNDYPGIAARALILKAKLCQKQGRYDEVRKLLKEVLKAAESPSMRYLKDIVVSTFPDVIVS
jgi:tetratricopeptide (TPR) repeat protein